jgi:2-polyprenyl-3-methyl-5-hydroxy-6-metoxy-1,4-benzoquinol methylase
MPDPNSELHRWKKLPGTVPVWDERNTFIANLIPDHSTVLDIGAGSQTLRLHLPSCEYTAVDIITMIPETIHADFNNNIIPELPATYDVVVCSGVLEYIVDCRSFVNQISTWGNSLICSYASTTHNPAVDRAKHGWQHSMTEAEFINLFHDTDHVVSHWKTHTIVMTNTV